MQLTNYQIIIVRLVQVLIILRNYFVWSAFILEETRIMSN